MVFKKGRKRVARTCSLPQNHVAAQSNSPNTDTSLILPKPGCKANNCRAIKVPDKPGDSTSQTPGASILQDTSAFILKVSESRSVKTRVNNQLLFCPPAGRSGSVWTEGPAGRNSTSFKKLPVLSLKKLGGNAKFTVCL